MAFYIWLAGVPVCALFILITIFIYSEYAHTCTTCTQQDLSETWNLLGVIPFGGYWLGVVLAYWILENKNKLLEDKK